MTKRLPTIQPQPFDDSEEMLYQHLEYDVAEPCSLPDMFFDSLQQSVLNYLRFEEYLERRKRRHKGKHA